MLSGRCEPTPPNFLDHTRAAKSVAGVSRLVSHVSIVFRCPEDRFGFANSDAHPCTDRIQLLTFERQNICQKGFNTIIHRICPDVVPELSGYLTVGRATADYPAMGFNKRKMEDARRQEAEKEAAARRATDRQILEDAEQLVTAWNELQAKRMPMLFSRTIGAAIKAGHLARRLIRPETTKVFMVLLSRLSAG
jgi:hypothetical protein